MIDVKITMDASALTKKVDQTHYYNYMNSVFLDISRNWQRTRYGNPSAYNPSVGGLTRLVKGKDSPLIDSGQLRMSQRVESNNQGKFIIGTDKAYGAMLMTGGTWTAKKVFVIPCTPEIKRMLKQYQKVKTVIAELRKKYNHAKNNSTVYSNKKGVFLVRKIGRSGYNWTRLLLFRKTIKMPKREIFYMTPADIGSLNQAMKAYFES